MSLAQAGWGQLLMLFYCSRLLAELHCQTWAGHVEALHPTVNVAVFGSGVTSVILSIPNVNEGLSFSATFDGSDITPGDWGSWSSTDITSVATIIDGLFLDSNVSPLVKLVVRYTVGGMITLLGFGADNEHEGWEPNCSARGFNIRHGGKPKGAECKPRHWAAYWYRRSHRQWGMRVLESWSSVGSKGFHPQLHGSGQCFTHWACRSKHQPLSVIEKNQVSSFTNLLVPLE